MQADYRKRSRKDFYMMIAKKTGNTRTYIKMLCEETFDEDMGEHILDVTDDGVYVMDVCNAGGNYTLLPTPFDQFVCELEERKKNKKNKRRTYGFFFFIIKQNYIPY